MCQNTHPLFLGTDYDTPTSYISQQQKTACANDGFPYFNNSKNSSRNSKDIGKLFLYLLYYFKMHNQYLKRIHDENTTFLYSMD